MLTRAYVLACCGLSALPLLGFSQAPKSAAPPVLADLAWLAGAWIEHKNGVDTEEHWMTPKGGLMMGMNRTVRPDGKTSFENLRIAQVGDKVVYLASPGGRTPPTEFPLVKLESKRAVFENPDHPFPRRIIYALDASGSLMARIEGTIQGRDASREWKWERIK